MDKKYNFPRKMTFCNLLSLISVCSTSSRVDGMDPDPYKWIRIRVAHNTGEKKVVGYKGGKPGRTFRSRFFLEERLPLCTKYNMSIKNKAFLT
jgi:hypothetical protein